METGKKSPGRYPWGTARRYNAFTDYFRKMHGARIQKVSVDAGFTCPNRDGTRGRGGCSFCNNKAFNPSYCLPEKSVSQQIDEGIHFLKSRYRKVKDYLVYFQAYSNTYAPTGTLSKLYNEALEHDGIKGLVIGTRPDCVDDEILDYLGEISRHYILLLEFGIESCYDKTLRRINRGHSFKDAVNALEAAAKRDIDTCAHFIFGLPGESRDEMLQEAEIISELPLKSLKLHQLQIIKGTKIEEEYINDPSDFLLFTLDNYIEFIIEFLERLNPRIIIERFSGEAPPQFLMNEIWGKKRTDEIARLIEKRMEELDTWQGRCYNRITA